jgi:serine/threonine-protein kinase
MPLSAGTRLGPYEILSALGSGGMGEVYRARDTKLDRDVAIKILPDALAADPERIARFEREARTLASLNHPNIAAIYGLEEGPAEAGRHTRALVIELVEGEDLSQRIARGPIPLDQALPIARQIVDALEAAHEQAIIHRDLKPANIKLRPDGTVKVLDFGLAKAMDPVGTTANVSQSPTLTTPAMTLAGMILGTAAYMSPEQAKGRPADKRSDVWAFGCVLYEMLTGKRAFEGDDVSDTLAAVLRGAPDWSALPASTPAPIGKLLRGCLEKDRKERVPDIAVARLEIKEALAMPAGSGAAAAGAPAIQPRPLWRRALPVVAAAVVAGAIVGAAAWALRPSPPSSPVTRFTFALGEGQQFTAVNTQSLAVSPDGTRLVYVANNQLYLRSMSDPEARPIPGTQQTQSPYAPVFSPDSQSIAFFSTVDRAVKKIAVSGGAAVTLCPAVPQFFGMNWDSGGIVFGQAKGIMRVSANGGQPEVLVSVKDGEVMYGPQVLPGGEWVLFTVATAATTEAWDKAQIVVQSLKSPERKTLVSGGSEARYLPTGLGSPKRAEREGGHLVYALGGVLFAVPFDLPRLAVTGGPVPIVEGVKRSSGTTGAAHFSVSSTGSLVFVPGPVSTSSAQSDLALIDRNGTVQPLKLQPGPYEYPRLSSDDKRIAVGSDDGKDAIVWIYDVAGASSARRLTLGGRNRVPVWSADGERVAFQSDRDGDLSLFWQRADGTTAAERLTKPDKDTAHVPESWSPDGKTLLFSIAKGSSYSVAALSLPDKKVTLFGGIQSPFPPAATFSPDGRWVAYSAGAPAAFSGSLFVQPFPATGATYPISKGGGFHPTWATDGKELFYGAGTTIFVAVSATTRPTFTFGNPVPVPRLFVERGPMFERNNDITRDGKHFLGVVTAGLAATGSGAATANQIQVVLNWFEDLKARVPGGK